MFICSIKTNEMDIGVVLIMTYGFSNERCTSFCQIERGTFVLLDCELEMIAQINDLTE